MVTVSLAVFQTDVEVSENKWMAGGALHVGISTANGTLSKVIVYRDRSGGVFEISESVQIEVQEKEGHNTYLLRRSSSAKNEGPSIEFEITINGLSDGINEGAASFTGYITDHSVQPESQAVRRQWKGLFICFRPTDMEIIRDGPRAIKPEIAELVHLTPFNQSHEDEVSAAASRLFQQLVIDCQSERGKNYFFQGRETPGSHLGSMSLADRFEYMKMASVKRDNQEMFYQAGMHLLCRSLRNAKWLDQEFSSQCQDRVESFFQGLTTADTDQGRRYRDCLRRCYSIAYVCLRPESTWRPALENPRATFDYIEKELRSVSFREHWLSRFINLEDQPGTESLRTWLSVLGDKLLLLKTIETGQFPVVNYPPEIDSIVDYLQKQAGELGLLRGSLVDPDTPGIDLKPTQVFNGESLRDLQSTYPLAPCP
ncbi:uncharacterized protein N7503_006419 [Penicillium pulvis]|uniref:uncharacterized protein n=1 Tax=Penicillium pulvis TaxID=1562058 RepID=UPI0025467875|nr:uncharacterized protein N7503_006419 [Penicillium pulvis]KAJ5798914.1 hypothetical protein N7503_006419 [Penicillium pulvis]